MMHSDLGPSTRSDEAAPRGLPSRLRLLCVSPVEPSWVSLTLRLDAAGCLAPRLSWVSTPAEALAALREEGTDCLLVADTGGTDFDAAALLQALRAGGCEEPIVLAAPHVDEDCWAAALACDAEVLVASNPWESPALLPAIRRGLERLELHRESHRLRVAQHKRLIRERDEAEHLLRQQRQILKELEGQTALPAAFAHDAASTHEHAGSPGEVHRPTLPAGLEGYYHELLRTYVIMGSGSLGGEIAQLAELLAAADLGPHDALGMHLAGVEALVRGLGSRSTRHVMARADLLALELMVHLAEWYQRRAVTGRCGGTEAASSSAANAAGRA